MYTWRIIYAVIKGKTIQLIVRVMQIIKSLGMKKNIPFGSRRKFPMMGLPRI
jgi:hypothetical protein